MSQRYDDVPDWQLPPGVTRGLWEYVHSDTLAMGYDEYLSGSPIPTWDQAFVEREVKEPGRVLDLGVGTGRVAIPLVQKGFEVVGVDLSEGMLEVANQNAKRQTIQLQLVRANLVELDALRDGTFDYALSLFATLGMIQGAANRLRMLHHVHRLLKPGGKLLLHVHNRWHSLWNASRWWLLKDLIKSVLPDHVPGERFMPPHQGVVNLYMHLFTAQELRCVLEATGFAGIHLQAIGSGSHGRLTGPYWIRHLRAMGYFATACRPYDG